MAEFADIDSARSNPTFRREVLHPPVIRSWPRAM